MILYRLASSLYPDLKGTGGLTNGGRWHHAGNRVTYLASSRSLAAWEKLMHIESLALIPDNLVMLTVDVPDEIIKVIDDSEFPVGWNSTIPGSASKDFGTTFLEDLKDAVLRVPSVVISGEYNYILNPLHPLAARVVILGIDPFNYDERLGNK